MTKTLVLSTGFEPLAEIPWQQAMKMWCAGRVEVVDEYRNQAIRTVSNRFQLPAVVRFISQVFRRHLKPQIRLTRRNLYLRDQGQCQYCGAQLSLKNFTLDHIHPRSKHGGHSWENLVVSCRPCNRKKANKSLKQAGFILRAAPVRPKRPLGVVCPYPNEWRGDMPEQWHARAMTLPSSDITEQ